MTSSPSEPPDEMVGLALAEAAGRRCDRRLLIVAMMSGLALPSCMAKPSTLIDVQVTVSTEHGTPAIPLPPSTVPSGQIATFTVDGRELHIIPSLNHGLVMIRVRMAGRTRDGQTGDVLESPELTVAPGPGRIVTVKMDTMTFAIKAVTAKSS